MQEKTQVFDKIRQGNTLIASDLTAEEKRRLADLMVRYGATGGYTYDRFFVKGFKPWELQGVDVLEEEFIKAHGAELMGEDEDGDKGYAFALTLDKKPGSFYTAIQKVRGLRGMFFDFMSDRGMLSRTTILKRFTVDDWKEYERRGVNSIIDEFIVSMQTKRTDVKIEKAFTDERKEGQDVGKNRYQAAVSGY